LAKSVRTAEETQHSSASIQKRAPSGKNQVKLNLFQS